ncbi:hypothetical protein GCM10027586_00190 [Kineococcus gypseus]|uniref:hypothetical protein n=1 Tax=Kineococcus gypseus TaxID=1637102 RepID=UPI003D7D09D1
MLTLMGASGVVLRSDRDVPYSMIENALHAQGFLDGYTIHIRPYRDQLMIQIQVSVPVSWITAAGVPELPAEQVLRALTDAVEEIDRASAE